MPDERFLLLVKDSFKDPREGGDAIRETGAMRVARGLPGSPPMRLLAPALLLAAALVAGCSGFTTVPLLSAAGMPVTLTPTKEIPLEIVTRSTGVVDPMPVDGSLVSFADVETTLGHAVSSAAVPWADAHKAQRPEGWQLTVELIKAEATYRGGRLVVTLGTRATLRARSTRTYLAQTQANCRQGGLVPPDQGAPVVFSCMERIGRDLAGWLGQIEP
jgi:hypothetical protein